MVRSNRSVTYLFIAFAMILLWGLIASIALDTYYRHVGLSISALITVIAIYYLEYLTLTSTTIQKELISFCLTVRDIFDCYKLSAGISTDHKDLYKRGQAKQDIDIAKEFKQISLRKSIKFERDLSRRGTCSTLACGNCSDHELKRYNDLKAKLESAQIAEVPELAELKDIDDDEFDDMIYTHQMKEFAAFAHTVLFIMEQT